MAEQYKNEEYLREEYLEKRRSTKEIARDHDVNGGTILYWLNKYDIETRDMMAESKRKRRVEYANFRMNDSGHELWKTSDTEGGEDICYVHRLLATLKYGFGALDGKDVHHENNIPWDNRLENLELMGRGEHTSAHTRGRDSWNAKSTPWRDEEALLDLYVDRGLSADKVGEELGCTGQTVLRWLKIHGIDTRSDYHAIQNYSRGDRLE